MRDDAVHHFLTRPPPGPAVNQAAVGRAGRLTTPDGSSGLRVAGKNADRPLGAVFTDYGSVLETGAVIGRNWRVWRNVPHVERPTCRPFSASASRCKDELSKPPRRRSSYRLTRRGSMGEKSTRKVTAQADDALPLLVAQ